jgi:hypothetical protein
MRKTLLIAAAALAAGVISSQAQVYSQNIVGYVNLPLSPGYNTVANPLDNATGNSLTNLMPGIVTGAYDGSYVYIWGGTTYTAYYVDSTQGGLNDFGDNGNVASPNVNPGTAIFFSANATNNITFVGTVHVDGAGTGTNVVGVTTNTWTGQQLLGSKLPIAGGISSVLGLPTGSGALDGSYLYIPKISGGALHGFTGYYIDSTLGGNGIADFGDNGLVAEPVIPVGGGLFIQHSGSFTWTQSL